MKTKRWFMLTIVLLATMMAMAQPDAPGNLSSYRGQNGISLAFKVTGKLGGRIWGGSDNIYTDDSSLSTAVVHSGLFSVGETAIVNVTILPGQESYPSLNRNGVTSNKYGSYAGSYQITGKESGTVTKDAQLAPTDGKLTIFRGRVGEFTFQVTGKTKGRIWGGDENIYTDDSDIATAAVHAGAIKAGQTGNVKVIFLGGYESYPSITRNGVTSNSYGSFAGSYKILNDTSDSKSE